MTNEQIAWLAGLFEGEGNIAFPGKFSVTLSINMTDQDVVQKCREVSGVGRLHGPYRMGAYPNAKPMWCWIVGREGEARELLPKLLPWLGERRSARAKEAISRLLNVRRKGFCRRGHPMSGENLYTPPCGLRICRACSKIREKNRKPTDKSRAVDRQRDLKPDRVAQKRAAGKRFRERRRIIKT